MGARLLAQAARACNSVGKKTERASTMGMMQLHRRGFMRSVAALGAMATLPTPAFAAPTSLPPPIGREERMARLARARALLKQQGIGAVLVESGPSLDYYTGIQWWRSERLTGVVIPAD